MRRPVGLLLLALGALLVGCEVPHKDTVMAGNADGVKINYFGDVRETEPLARQFCARFERVPLLRKTESEDAYYACVRPDTAPPGGHG